MRILKIAGAAVLALIAADYLKAGGNPKNMRSVKTVGKMCRLQPCDQDTESEGEEFCENIPEENAEAKEKLKKDIEDLYELQTHEAEQILSSLSRVAARKKRRAFYKEAVSGFLHKH